ncbi:MAG: Fic family protein [Trueperaceae bacterium]|nr:MAG: Fic family protein [Trueperaceae bacterium]
MKRGMTGTFRTTSVAGESVQAFVPHALPPEPPLVVDGRLHTVLEAATLAVGRLDGVSTLLPDKALFLYAFVRKEALVSSQIEGTQSSLSDLLLFEADEMPGVPLDDVQEVSSYVAALDHGVSRLRGGFPLSGPLIREVHDVLLRSGRGKDREPGSFRRSQNWIGGSRPGNAHVVPPPHKDVAEAMAQLETFLNARDDGLPWLVRAALAHVQFETIHPFLDGNGRVGRLLITLLLCDAGVLREPLLYLSLFLKRNRARYDELLDLVRAEGDWEAWLEFFANGVEEAAQGAVDTAVRLSELFASDRTRIEGATGRRAGSVLRVHEALKARPLRSITDIAATTGLSYPGAAAAVDALVELGIAREFTGRMRDRLFVYERYVAILGEGTEVRVGP